MSAVVVTYDLVKTYQLESVLVPRRHRAKVIGFTTEIDSAAPALSLPFERPLYAPVRKPRFDSQDIRPAGSDEETDPTALFEQAHVDPGPLRDAVRTALRRSAIGRTIIAVRDNTKPMILAAMHSRLGNDKHSEFHTACAQVERIALLRLRALLPEL